MKTSDTNEVIIKKIHKALQSEGLEYMITRVEGTIAHINVYVGNDGLGDNNVK
jgi:hypothetical protein